MFNLAIDSKLRGCDVAGGAIGIGLNCCCAFVIRSFCARAGETKTQMKHNNETARLLFMVTSLARFDVHGNYDLRGS
jgi:hypothetical protein